MRKIAIIFLLLAAILLSACSSGGYLVIGGDKQAGNQGGAQNPSNNLDGVYFVINTNSRLIHTSTCGIGGRISAANRAIFDCIHDAISRGFNPCRTCLRDFDPSQVPPPSNTDTQEDCDDCCPPYVPVGAEYYLASVNSAIFHENTCGIGQRIHDANRRIFTTFDQAVAVGLRPCQTCMRGREFTPPPQVQTQPPNNPPPPQPPAAAEYYLASINSEVFHENTCNTGQRIHAANRRIFTTFDQAVAAGLRPCQTCMRDREFTPPLEPPRQTQPPNQPPQPPAAAEYYIGNINSRAFHANTCGTGQRIGATNRRIFASFDEAVAAGFHPCGICLRNRDFTPPQPPIQTQTPNNPPPPSQPPAAAEYFLSSVNSEVFHINTCNTGQRIHEANRRFFATFDEAIAAGLRPCGHCLS